MPFAYYGSKHGLAPKYPPPAYATIIEPFAGAAGYACYWATDRHRVILIDRDPSVVTLWHELQSMTPADVTRVERQLLAGRVTHPLLCALVGSTGWTAGRTSRQVTPRMITNWPAVRRRILRLLDRVRRWQVIEADYHDAPDLLGTWFIDPPYQPHRTMAGTGYIAGADALDYAELAEWSRARAGQVIVCEQAPAAWLPFRPFANQQAYVTRGRSGNTRTELIWTRGPGRTYGETPWVKAQRSAARDRAGGGG